MARFDCAFASNEVTTVTKDDLILAVLICSKTYEEFLAFIENENFLDAVRQWGEQVGKYDLLEKVSLFKEYMETANTAPKYWEDIGDSKTSGAHWTQAVKVVLTGHLNYTESEALNCPLPKALADFFKHAETSGVIRLMTPEEISYVEAAEREDLCQA